MSTSFKNVPINIKLTVFALSFLIFFFLNYTSVSYIFMRLIYVIYRFTGWYLMIEFDTLFFIIVALVPVFGMFYHSTGLLYSRNQFALDLITISCSASLVFTVGLILQGIVGHHSNPLIPVSLKAGLFPFYSHFTLLIGIALPFLLRPIQTK